MTFSNIFDIFLLTLISVKPAFIPPNYTEIKQQIFYETYQYLHSSKVQWLRSHRASKM